MNLFEVLERFYPGCYAAALTCWERLRGESWTPTKMDPAAAPRAPLGK
ncbi:MAG: hypothetical protein KC492_37970 [Myxococcales bacterium]|nr:hypothetical protein [Myxococcales bacterium]